MRRTCLPRRERRSRDGKGGKGKGRHNTKYNKGKHNEPSAADLQAKADMEFARKLQAQINGTTVHNEWQRQSSKGSAKRGIGRDCGAGAPSYGTSTLQYSFK